ncbi:MAG: chemotaxis protein CheB [Pirellulales bacterium]
MAKKSKPGQPTESRGATLSNAQTPAHDAGGDGRPSAVPATDGEQHPTDFPIVGIGASAGGLQALKQFLDALPNQPGVAIVIVQHLDPTRKSLTAELLAAHTSMQLCEVSDSPRVLPNSVYVIPPGKYLTISGGELHLSDPEEPRGARMSIDNFLRSLANDLQQRSVGIIMSGGGTDGTLGIKQIKEVGGMVMVQDPDSAEHDSMPRSAIETGVVDFILPPAKLAAMLVRYAAHSYVREPLTASEQHPDAKQPPVGTDVFLSILSLLRVRSKHDFRNYKHQTLIRRTTRRMCLAHMDDYAQYLEYLREHPEEIDALVKDLLISVTNFFRDEEAWEELRERAIIPIVEQAGPDDTIRVWVPGCATGEEPYSIAMMLTEELTRTRKVVPVQIFASDIDKDALDFARQGVYPNSIQADVSPDRLQRFFVKIEGNDHFRVGKQIREMVVFAEQNLIGDPPFSKLDLVCCRNLLIYLKPDVQEKVITLFHFALRETGLLFLGTAETIGRQSDLFRPMSKRWRIFRRTGPPRPERVEIPVTAGAPRREVGIPEQHAGDMRESRLAHLANQWMVDWLSPAAILIDAKWNILYIHGNVDKYMQHPQGVPKDDLLEKARRGIRIKLRSAVHRAFEQDQVVTVDAQVEWNETYHPVLISVRPIRDAKEDRKLALVVFEDRSGSSPETSGNEIAVLNTSALKPRRSEDLPAHRDPVSGHDLDENKVIRQLEQELAATRDDLQATLEQFEASNEEFKAANEEVMSINEELQSTNEELETSKEELQSLNEELSTVNNQLAAKVEELETQHADLKNLVGATNVATVCLDRDIRIRWFTPAATRVIRLSEADAGRPLSDFAHDFDHDDLGEVTRQVLRTLVSVEDEVTCHDDRTYLRRVLPYRTEDDHIGGVIITFVDISERKRSEVALAKSEQQLRELAKSLEKQVEHRIGALRVFHDVTMAANEAKSFEAAVSAALESVTEYNGWIVGHAWRPSLDEIVLIKAWHCRPDARELQVDCEAFRQATELEKLSYDDPFIGEVVRTGRLQWLPNLTETAGSTNEFPRRFGLRSAIAFPVVLNDDVVAVLAFFSNKRIERDDRFMEIMPQVGIQLGHVFERKRLEREVALIADKEQRRMGQEMHDGLSQHIAGLAILASRLAESLKTENSPSAERAEKLAESIEDAKSQARALAKGLLPIDINSAGLVAALHELADRTQRTYDIACVFQGPEAFEGIESFVATHLYRIAREAVHNAVKHSKARQIGIELATNLGISLIIRDDGVGFDSDRTAEGEGLRIMRYRADLIGANLVILPRQEGGTVVRCSVDS